MPDDTSIVTPPEIAGKLLWVHPVREAPKDVQGFLIEFPELESRAGKVFLKGRQVNLYNGRWVGYRHMAMAWSAIVHYIVFESRDDYVSRLKVWQRVYNARSS